MTLRKLGSRSFVDLKSEQNLKTFIRNELKDMVSSSVRDYLQQNKVPVATIDINMDKDCQHCSHNPQQSSSRALRLNVSTAAIEASKELNKKDEDNKKMTTRDDNIHWMTWITSKDEAYDKITKDTKDFHHEAPLSSHRYRCSSPFSRPSTAYNNNNCTNRETSLRCRSSSVEPRSKSCFHDENKPTRVARCMTSVAVGPDRHFEEKGTITQKSYQVSDYLKKNMDLNDPYERNVYSTLMDVMRKKMVQKCGVESEAGDPDPIIQISEYKHRFQNPRSKITFPTSNTQKLVTVKKPPLCPHKTRPLGQVRPHTSSSSRLRCGEQFLF